MIISRISKTTDLDIEYIRKLVRSASYRYKVYEIPKRTGGFRQISHPSAELKLLQRWVTDTIFLKLPVHDSVYSYRIGRGIQDLAALHKRNNYLLRIDFTDFFPSIKGRDVSALLRKNADMIPFPLSKNDIQVISSIVCKDGCLTIGAPSSPAITNAILFDFDSDYYKKAFEMKIVYSRYADDIYFSTNHKEVLGVIFNEFIKDLRRLRSPKLSINEKKTIFSSKKNKRIITGLVITSKRQISIGRNKKRYIKSLVYRFAQGHLDDSETTYLRGFLSYVKAVEPTFLASLRRKYGQKTINKIIKSEIFQRKKSPSV